MLRSTWQLQDAKARLSELLKRAERDGPQHITLHGRPAAVVLSAAEYDRLVRRQLSLPALIAASPLKGVELELDRDRSPARDLRL